MSATAARSLTIERVMLPSSTTTGSSSSDADLQDPVCAAHGGGTSLVGCESGAVLLVSLRDVQQHSASCRRVLGRHAGRVTGVCAFPWQPAALEGGQGAGSLFATCSADSTLKVWAAHNATDACVQTLRGHKAACTCVAALQVAHAWSLVSGGADGNVLLWRADGDAGGQLVPHLQLSTAPLHSSPAWVLGLACQLQPAAAGASQGVFAVLARQPLMQLHVDRQAADAPKPRSPRAARRPSSRSASTRLQADSHASNFLALKLLQRAMAVLTLGYDGACRLHSLVEGGAPGGVSWCWRSPTGSAYTAMDVVEAAGQQEHQGLVLLGDDRGHLHLFCLDSERLIATKQVAGHGRIRAVCCCGARGGSSSVVEFAVLSPQQGLSLWRLQLQQASGHSIAPGGHRQGLIALQVCAAGLPASSDAVLMSAGLDGRVMQWALSGDAPAVLQSLSTAGSAAAGPAGAARPPKPGEMTSMCHLQGCLATGHEDGHVLLWRFDAGSHSVLQPPGHSNSVCALAPRVAANGEEQLLSGGFDGTVCLWEPRTLRGIKPHMLARFRAHGAEQPQAALRSSSGSTGSSSNALAVLAAAEPPEVLTLLLEPRQQVVITGGSSGTIRVWAHDTNQLLGQHVGHVGPVTCLCLDACLLFSGSQDSGIRIWDAVPGSWSAASAQQHSTSPGRQHKAVPCSAAFSVLRGHRGPVTGLAVLASTGLLLSCSEDGQLLQWSYFTGTLLTKVKLGGQPLTCLAVVQDRASGRARALVGSATGQLLSVGVSDEQLELPADAAAGSGSG